MGSLTSVSESLAAKLRRRLLFAAVVAGLSACASQPPAPVVDISAGSPTSDTVEVAPELQAMIDDWKDPTKQVVEPFKIFDNLYYVGINFVAAYVLQTSEGLILIDSLFGPWVEPMLANIEKLGLDPQQIHYVLVTHGHFDHAGGAAEINRRFGATVVMTEEDWALARESATIDALAFEVPDHGMTAEDGDIIELGDTRVELFKTPGHTEGVLSLKYPVRDGDNTHKAITLGGVGLNFTGIKRTESYLQSYTRLRSELTLGVSVSLPNHAQMGRVFERQKQLDYRRPGQTHPFVDAPSLQADLARLISNAETKLAELRNGD